MAVAKIIESGSTQSLEFPEGFRINAKEVEITKDGDVVTLRPIRKGMGHVVDLIMQLPDDMFDGIKDDRPPELRDGL